MPAPRYVNEFQENALWISLASLWAAGGWLAWLTSLGSNAQWLGSSSALTVWAGLAVAVSVALRLPILTTPPSTSLHSDHAVWLLTLFATVNWLGFFLLQANQWSEVLPAILLLITGEVWFHVTAWQLGVLPWCRQGLLRCFHNLANLGVEPIKPDRLLEQNKSSKLVAADSVVHADGVERSLAGGSRLGQSSDYAVNHAEGVERNLVQGVDEQGRRYFSGDITIHMASEQTTDSVPVSFCPPFIGQPQIDFEIEVEEVAVQLIHSSPAGMRLGLRRSDAQEALVFQLQWYAIEVELDQTPVAGALIAGSAPLP